MEHRQRTKELFQGVRDLISECSAVYEDAYADDHHVGFNFHTDRHEYTVSFDWSLNPDGTLTCSRWHGNGSGDIAEGPMSGDTWRRIKDAIEKEDRDCHEYHVDFKEVRLRRLDDMKK